MGGHGHGHDDAGHSHGTKDLEQPLLEESGDSTLVEEQKKLRRAVYFALFMMFVEIFGGVLANSLAIITDAAHMLSDVGGFIVSLACLHLATQGVTTEYTFGFKQAEVLGALLSITIVWALTAILLWEAFQRFYRLEEINAPYMFAISTLGFFVNLILMKVLGHNHSHGGHGHSHGGHGHSHEGHGHGDHGGESHGGHGGHGDHGGHGKHSDHGGGHSHGKGESCCDDHGGGHDGHSGHDSHNHGGHGGHSGHDSHDHGGHGGHSGHDSHDHGGHGGHGGHSGHDSHDHGGHGSHGGRDRHDSQASSHAGNDHDAESASLAMKAAIAHVIGDIVQSLGVCVAAGLIWWHPFDIGVTENGVSNWNYADPLCTVLFGILVLLTTKSTLQHAINNLMVKAPPHIDQAKLIRKILTCPHVKSVHDLHVWSFGSNDVLCTAHVMVDNKDHVSDTLKAAIKVAQKMGIGHSTFQIEVIGEFDPELESYGIHANPLAR